jgi:formyl-CoA transferase
MLGCPIHLSGSETVYKRAPLLGEHTNEILEQEVGLAVGEIAELREAKVI